MNTWVLSFAKKVIEERYGKPTSVTLLSNNNNLIWKVMFDVETFVVKEVLDETVDVKSEQALYMMTGSNPLFRPILDVFENDENNRKTVIYPFIEGVSLDKILQSESYSLEEAQHWSSQMIQSFEILRDVYVDGWGKGKSNDNECHDTWFSFLFSYLEEQKLKGPKIAVLRYDALISTINKYKKNIEKAVTRPSLVCGDVNARNYLITPARNLICIHTPMMWRSDPAVPYGDALVHLDSSLFGDCFYKLADYPNYRMWLYAAFSAYVILAYVERFSSEPLEKALPWGGKRSLLDILDYYLNILN